MKTGDEWEWEGKIPSTKCSIRCLCVREIVLKINSIRVREHGILQHPSLCSLGFTFTHHPGHPPLCPQRGGRRDSHQRAPEASPAFLRWASSQSSVLTGHIAECETKGESDLCEHRWTNISKTKGQAALWLLTQLDSPPPQYEPKQH